MNKWRILRHGRHPNCIPAHGAGIDVQNGDLALVFVSVQGKELQAIVGNTESPPTPSDAGICLDEVFGLPM